MLYDNALLARVYAHWWRATGSPLAARIAVETCEFIVRELGTAGLDRPAPISPGRRRCVEEAKELLARQVGLSLIHI